MSAGQLVSLLSKNSYSFQNSIYLVFITPPFNVSIKTQLCAKSCLPIILVCQKFRSKFLIYSHFTFKTLWDLIWLFILFLTLLPYFHMCVSIFVLLNYVYLWKLLLAIIKRKLKWPLFFIKWSNTSLAKLSDYFTKQSNEFSQNSGTGCLC